MGEVDRNHRTITSILSVMFGVLGLIVWVSPLIGAPIDLIGFVLGAIGIRSQSRRVAIAGSMICLVGLVLAVVNAFLIARAYLGIVSQPSIGDILIHLYKSSFFGSDF